MAVQSSATAAHIGCSPGYRDSCRVGRLETHPDRAPNTGLASLIPSKALALAAMARFAGSQMMLAGRRVRWSVVAAERSKGSQTVADRLARVGVHQSRDLIGRARPRRMTSPSRLLRL